MKAIVYTEYGPTDVLQLKEVDKPALNDGEILIRVRATEVTKSDCEMRSFKFPVKWFWLPLRIAFGLIRPKRQILGGYFAGEVESVGRGVERFRQGDAVFGTTKLRLGAYAEYVSLPADYTIVLKPETMNFEEAAAVPLGGLNALHFMRRAQIRKGETLLINGAGGSIGTHALLIAKHLGAEVTVVDRGLKEERLRALGADHFIDYTRQDFCSSGETYDVIFDMVAGSSYSACIRTLKPQGRYITANPRLSAMVRSVFTTRYSDKKAMFAFARETREELMALKDMIERGEIGSIVDRVYPLEQAAEAQRRVETEQRVGAVVIRVTGA